MNMQKGLSYLKARLSEPSTWRGLVVLISLAGVSLSPEQTTAIITVGAAVVGAIGAFVPDKAEKPTSTNQDKESA